MTGSERHVRFPGWRRARALTFGIASLALLLAGQVVESAAQPSGESSGLSAQRVELPVQEAGALRADDSAAWSGVPEVQLLLTRTPPLYAGDPLDDGDSPSARIGIARCGEATFVRLRWSDDTESVADPSRSYPDAGEAAIYKRHSTEVDQFADAVCVMVPQQRGPHPAFPTLVMGSSTDPVDLYFWHRERGFEWLRASGRSTTASSGRELHGTARRTAEGWSVVLEIPDLEDRTPIAVAVWDGAREHRDGLKYFSPWYEVTP